MTSVASGRIETLTELDAGHEPFDVTDARAMAALRDAEDRHFWFRSRNELIDERLLRLGVGKRFIDLGCGGGSVTAHLARRGRDVVGVDGHRALVELAASRAPSARFWVHDLSRGVDVVPERDFDAAGLFDVIEHLDEPVRALADATSLVAPGGYVVGTVPALPSLWSRVDEQAGHRVRYVRDTLRMVLERVVDAEVVEVVPFHRLLVPLLYVQRRMVARRRGMGAVSEANMWVPPRLANAALLRALRLERRSARFADLTSVQGASLWFAIRRRPFPPVVPRGGVEPPT